MSNLRYGPPMPKLSRPMADLCVAMTKTKLPLDGPEWRAVECACKAALNGGPSLRAAVEAVENMPEDVTNYEKGFAWGLAFALVAVEEGDKYRLSLTTTTRRDQ